MTDTTSLKDGEAHPAAFAALQYLEALSFEERQDFLLTFSSLALEGNRLAEVCYGTLRRIIDGEPVSDRYALGLAWEIKSIRSDAGAARHEVEAELAVNMTDDKSIPALSLRGEEFLSALLLAMVQEHCTGHSPEKARLLDAAQATYLSPDPSPAEWLDSYGSPANAAAMRELHAGGEIEIAEQDGARIVGKLTPEGRALLDRLRAEQQRER